LKPVFIKDHKVTVKNPNCTGGISEPMGDHDYDLVVIGRGRAGQKAAINAAKLGKRVAVIEGASTVGGASVHTGTIPSKTLRLSHLG
jgi:NADPH-dependent 2,4-dienoyl-CoA reductase/sulfur reductase-like enzyme